MKKIHTFFHIKHIIISAISLVVAIAFMVLVFSWELFTLHQNYVYYICFLVAPLFHFLVMFALEKTLAKLLNASVKQYYFWCYAFWILVFILTLIIVVPMNFIFESNEGARLIITIFAMCLGFAVFIASLPTCFRILARETDSVFFYYAMVVLMVAALAVGYVKSFHTTHIAYNDVFVRESSLSTVKEIYGEFDHIEKDAFDGYWGQYRVDENNCYCLYVKREKAVIIEMKECNLVNE